MDDFTRNLIDKIKESAKDINELNKWEGAVLSFTKVCGDCNDIEFQQYSPYIIRVAASYIILGFDKHNALEYATEFGEDGYEAVRKMSFDRNITIGNLKS